MIRQYKVFIASSLQHTEEREFIAKTFMEGNCEDLQFFPTLQDKNGEWSITPGVSSQSKINDKALVCNAFLLYVRDNIGRHTITEFEDQIKNGDLTNHFIFVIHHPGKEIESIAGNNPIPWKDFYADHLANQPETQTGDHGTVTYYEIQANPGDNGEDELKEKILQIKREMERKLLVALSPADMDYRRLLSPVQEEYRLDFNYYYHRKVDDELTDIITSGDSYMTIVSGMSLAGKTRSVVNALSKADNDSVRIHFFRGADSNATDDFLRLNVSGQFIPGKKNILVIDDIDLLLLSSDKDKVASDEIVKKFNEICSKAKNNPSLLSIIATSCIPVEELMNPLRNALNNPSTFADPTSIEIPAMSLKEMHEIARTLRGIGRLDPEKQAAIRGGMPLGMLFVNLSGIRAKYKSLVTDKVNGADNKSLFDAIKTISIWKRTNRFDFDLLFDFIAKTIDDEWFPKKKALYNALLDLAPLVTAKALSRTEFSYNIEDVIIDSVLRFEKQAGEIPSSDDLFNAGQKIIRYVDENLPQTKFQALSKLCIRVFFMRPYGEVTFKRLVEAVDKRWPADSILDEHELVETSSEFDKDWVDEWLSVLSMKLTLEGKISEVEKLYAKRPSHLLLTALLQEERKNSKPRNEEEEQEEETEDDPGSADANEDDSAQANGIWSAKLFNADGELKPEFADTSRMMLVEEIVLRMNLDKSLKWFETYDFDNAAKRWIIKDSDYNDAESRAVNIAKIFFNFILPKVTSIEELDLCLALLDKRNNDRLAKGAKPFFNSDAEKYLWFINAGSWNVIAKSVPSARVVEIFDRLANVKIDETTEEAGVTPTRLAMVLNSLMRPMGEFDAVACWEKMGNLRDSYTLRLVMNKQPDYANAKGFFDSFMESERGKKIKANDIILNTLLQKVKISSDLYDCQESFLHYGFLKKGQSISDLHDPYIMGILYNREFWDYDALRELARKHLEAGVRRPVKTTGVIVNRAPDYLTTRALLYDYDNGIVAPTTVCRFLSPKELDELRDSPMVVSWIFAKAKTDKEGKDARRFLTKLIDYWQQHGVAESYFSDPEGHLMSQLIKNHHIFPGQNDIEEFLDDLKRRGITYEDTTYLHRALTKRILDSDEYDHAEKIEEANKLVLWTSSKARKAVWRATDLRLAWGKEHVWSRLDLDKAEQFPLVTNGQWETQVVSGLDFFMNMLSNRYAHPKTLQRVLCNLINALDGKRPDIKGIGAKGTTLAIIKLAKASKTFINGRAFSGLRDRFLNHGIDIEPLCTEYSIISELCAKLNKNKITAEKAEQLLTAYEQRKHLKIHRSQAFYDSVISSRVCEPIDTILQAISSLPSGIVFSERMFCGVVRGIRNLEDLKKLEAAYTGPETKDRYVGIILAIHGIKEIKDPANRDKPYKPITSYADKEAVLRHILNYDPASDTISPSTEKMGVTEITALLSMFNTMSYRDIMRYISDNNLSMRESTVFNFIYRCETADDYRLLEPFIPGGKLTSNLVNALLNRIYDFKKDYFRRNLFEYFNFEDVVEEWSQIMNQPGDPYSEKLRGKLGSLSKKFYDSGDDGLRALSDFAYDVIHCNK